MNDDFNDAETMSKEEFAGPIGKPKQFIGIPITLGEKDYKEITDKLKRGELRVRLDITCEEPYQEFMMYFTGELK